MSLKQELVEFLKVNNKSNSTFERDIDIVLHYFGFGKEYAPTLVSTGEQFGGLTRERVRQIIEKKFRLKNPKDHHFQKNLLESNT